MTVAEWLRGRAPAAPPELLERMVDALGQHARRDAKDAPDACVTAAEQLVRALVARPDAGREAALDLLSADALVTYAFEAGADTPGWIAEQAPAAMARFATAVGVKS